LATKASASVVIAANPGITSEEACDIRAHAWSYVFACFERHQSKEVARPGDPDDAKGKSDSDSRATENYTG
jgi:hypothetical protein